MGRATEGSISFPMAKPLMTIDPADEWEWACQPTTDEPSRRRFALLRRNRKPRELGWLVELGFHTDLPDIGAKLVAIALARPVWPASLNNLDDPT